MEVLHLVVEDLSGWGADPCLRVAPGGHVAPSGGQRSLCVPTAAFEGLGRREAGGTRPAPASRRLLKCPEDSGAQGITEEGRWRQGVGEPLVRVSRGCR